MKRLRLCLVSLILFASITSTIPARSEVSLSGFKIMQVYWGTDQPKEVSPGDVETLTVVMRYELGYSFTGLKADLSLPGGFKAVGGGGKATAYYTAPITLGSIVKLSFPISISPDVVKDNYKADLRLEYIYVTAPAKEELKVPFGITGKPHIDVKFLNETLYEGNQRIVIALSNDGDATARNLEIVRVYSTGVSVELEDSESIGDLEPDYSVTVPLSLFVPIGMRNLVLPLAVEVSCLGPDNVAYLFSETLQLPVKPSDLVPSLRLSLQPEEFSIGKTGKVYVELENIGRSPLSDMKLVFAPDTTIRTPDTILRFLGATVFHVKSIGSGESAVVEAGVHVPSTTTASTASLIVVATYFDEGLKLSQTETRVFTILLKPTRVTPPLSLSLQTRELGIGKMNRLCLDLLNSGGDNLSELQLTLSPDATFKIFGETAFHIERLEPGESERVETVIYVPSSTVAPTASLTVSATYFDEGLWSSKGETQVFSVLLKPSDYTPPLALKLVPREVDTGKTSSLYVELENVGDYSLSEVTLTLTPDSVLRILGSTVFYVDRLDSGESRQVETDIYVSSSTVASTASLTATVSYFDEGLWLAQSETRVLSLLLKPTNPMPPLVFSLAPAEVSIGKSSTVHVDMTNAGDRGVSEIRLTLTPDTMLKIFGPTVFYVDRLSPGESRRVEAEVYVPSNTVAPTASLTLAATYVDEDFLTSKTESHVLSVLLRGLIEISLTDFAVIPSTPRAGSPFSVTMTVTNIGTSPAYAASAAASLEGLPLRTFGSRSVYIGNIEAFLPTTFTVNLQLLNTTEKSIALPIVLSYMDNLRSLHNVTFRVPMEVAAQTASPLPGPSGGIPFLGSLNVELAVVAAAAVTIAAVVMWKRRKK